MGDLFIHPCAKTCQPSSANLEEAEKGEQGEEGGGWEEGEEQGLHPEFMVSSQEASLPVTANLSPLQASFCCHPQEADSK